MRGLPVVPVLFVLACGGGGGADGDGDSTGGTADSSAAATNPDDGGDTTTATDPDPDGASDLDIPPPNEAPVAMFTATPEGGPAPLSVVLDASASTDSDGTIVSYDWMLGADVDDGVMVMHDFVDVGCYDVTLTVTDDEGATGTAEGVVVVAQGAAQVPPMVTVDVSPRPSAVLPRDLETDEGTATFHGMVASQGYTHVLAEVLNAGVVHSSVTAPVCGAAPVEFMIDVPIPSELTAFDVRLSLVGGETPQEFFSVTDLVAGDLYLVQGQSNAVAAGQSGDANENQNAFVRSFGSNTQDGAANAADVAWRIAEGNAGGGPAAIGQWAIRMGALLSMTHQTPIGIVNGGLGGQPISFFQRNDGNTTDPATNYGRVLTRLRNAGIDHSLRAILWYQGEADGANSQVHHDGFVALKDDWTEDFGGFERIYVTQLRAGCGGDLLNSQEVQRVLPDDFAEMTVMSTTGLDAHDGCHYAYENGYRELGNRYAALLGRDLYEEMPANDVAPPNPDTVQLMNGGTEVHIAMRNTESVLTFAEGAQNDFRIEGTAVTITGGSASAGEVVLTLSGDATGATGVSYLGHVGAGPWVLNENGVGLLAFGHLPITR
jgi:PKD repeat protein